LLLFADVDIYATGVCGKPSSEAKVIRIGGGRFYRPIARTRKSNDGVSYTTVRVDPDHSSLVWANRFRLGNRNACDGKPRAAGGAHVVKLHVSGRSLR
jgi:hypothetical protein